MKIQNTNNQIVALLLFVGTLFFCSEAPLDENTAAIVGKHKISAEDLLLSYELFPTWSPAKTGETALRAQLDLLIQKKLFALEGRSLGYQNDPQVARIVGWYSNEELRKALYRSAVEKSIHISEPDLLAAYYKNNLQLQVRHLFAKTAEQIFAIQQVLEKGVPWEEIARRTFQDSTLANNGGDLGWLAFGEMEATFEDSAFAQRIGQISQPVRTRYGYHLIQVVNARQNMLLSQDDFIAKKPALQTTLFNREAKKRSAEFLTAFMADRNVQMINKTFDFLVSHIRDQVIDSRTGDNSFKRAMNDFELNDLSRGLDLHKNDVLITFNGGQWTVGDFMKKLQQLPTSERPRMDSPSKFRHDLGIMIRDDFLTQEAKRRGLEKDPLVQKEVKRWEDDHIFSRLWQSIQDTLTISDAQAERFFTDHSSRYWLPDQVRVQEILVRTFSEAVRIVKQLRTGADFTQLAQQFSLRKTASDRAGDLGWMSRGQMGNISRIAFQMDSTQISDPIPVEGGFSVIKILEKENQRNKTFDEAKPEVMADLRRELSGTIYNQWVKKLQSKTTIRINDSLLTQLGRQLANEKRIAMPGNRF